MLIRQHLSVTISAQNIRKTNTYIDVTLRYIMILISGQNLQRKYSNGAGNTTVISDTDRKQQQNDHNALKDVARAKRAEREARQEKRIAQQKPFNVKAQEKIIKLDVDKVEKIDDIINEPNRLAEVKVERVEQIKNSKEDQIKSQGAGALSKTNALAREYNLPAPNNPEALKHDRLHCYTCDRELDQPNNYKKIPDEIKALFGGDEEVRTLCCWCFGRMSTNDVKFTAQSGMDATKEIRMAIYDPIHGLEEKVEKQLVKKVNETEIEYEHRIESAKRAIPEDIAEVVKMTDLEKIRLKSKIKQYENVINMVGNIKHDDLADGDYMENKVLYDCKGIYACTL